MCATPSVVPLLARLIVVVNRTVCAALLISRSTSVLAFVFLLLLQVCLLTCLTRTEVVCGGSRVRGASHVECVVQGEEC